MPKINRVMAARITLDADEFNATADFIRATVARMESLRAEQKHEDAARLSVALRRLVNTIKESQAEHGFSAFLLLGDEIAMAEQWA